MFTITNKLEQIAWNNYKKEVDDWKGYVVRNMFFQDKDWYGYEEMGRMIEDKWRVIFNELSEKQNQMEAAKTLVLLSKTKKPINKKTELIHPIRSSERISKLNLGKVNTM